MLNSILWIILIFINVLDLLICKSDLKQNSKNSAEIHSLTKRIEEIEKRYSADLECDDK